MTAKVLGMGKRVRNYKHLIVAANQPKTSSNAGEKLLSEEPLIKRSKLNDLVNHFPASGTPSDNNSILKYAGTKHARQGKE